MNIKTSYRYFWIVILVLLSACGPVTPVTPIPPSVIVMPAALPTFTPNFGTPTLWPTFDPKNQPTLPPTPLVNEKMVQSWLTQNAIATPIRRPVDHVTMRSPAVNERDGNIYFVGVDGQPMQITNSGKDRDPILSDDGKKVVFYRGEENDNVYSINADGSDERLIIQSKALPTLGQGEIKALTFMSKTHYLLFNTYLCNPRPKGPSYNATDCTVSIYSMDTDIGEINGFLSGLSGNILQYRNFEVSPDGKFISVANSGHVDIYYASRLSDSDMVYQNAIVYWRTKPDEYLPKQYWLPDSSGLIAIAAADREYNEPATLPATYVVYRYKLGETATQMPLEKTIMRSSAGDDWSISPDRNWLLFTHFDMYTGTNYLGNLNNGHIQAIQPAWWFLSSCVWSQDSKHFALNHLTPGLIGSVNGSPIIFVNGAFTEWIDNTHYFYTVGNNPDTYQTYIGEIPSK